MLHNCTKLIIIIIGIFIPNLITSAQNKNNLSYDYFPLAVGNRWTYTNSYDTSYKWIKTVYNTTRINGKLCYLYGVQNSFADTLFKDSVGNVWKYSFGNERLWFDFTLGDGSTYIYKVFDKDTMFVHVRKNLEEDVPAGHYNECIDLFFDIPYLIDDERGYAFAPDVGIIKEYGAWANSALLRFEIVNILPLEPTLYQNYPNPFNLYTRICFDIPRTSQTSLKIFDILGREIATVVDELKYPDSYNVLINSSMLASGVYIYRLKVADRILSRKFMVMR